MKEIVVPQSWKPLIPSLAMLGMGLALIWPSNSDGLSKFWGWLCLLMAGPLFILWLLRMLKGEPALVINDRGIMDGTRFFKKFQYSWDEVQEIRRTGNPYMGQRSILIRTQNRVIPVTDDLIAVDLEELNRKIKQSGEFHGKAKVDHLYRNAKMTVDSFEMTLLMGVLFGVLMIGAIFLTMLDMNVYLRLIAFWPISLVTVLVFWHFPVTFNPHFRNRRHPPVKYLLLTSFSAVALIGLLVILLGRWATPKGAMVIGVLIWLRADQIFRQNYAQ